MGRIEVYLNYFLLVPKILNATSVWVAWEKIEGSVSRILK